MATSSVANANAITKTKKAIQSEWMACQKVNGKANGIDIDSVMKLYNELLKLDDRVSITEHVDHLQEYARIMSDPVIKNLFDYICTKQFNRASMDALLWVKSYFCTPQNTLLLSNSSKSKLATVANKMHCLAHVPHLKDILAWVHVNMQSNPVDFKKVTESLIQEQARAKPTTLNTLPGNVLQMILNKLPTSNVRPMRQVNKLMKSFIDHPHIKQNHPMYFYARLCKLLIRELDEDDYNFNTASTTSSSAGSSTGSSVGTHAGRRNLSSLEKLFEEEGVPPTDPKRESIMNSILISQAHLNSIFFRCCQKRAFQTLQQLLDHVSSLSHLVFPLEIAVLIIMICDTEDEDVLNLYNAATKKRSEAGASATASDGLTLSKILQHCENINDEAMAFTSGWEKYGYFVGNKEEEEEEDSRDHVIESFRMTCYLPVSVLTSLLNVWKIPVANGQNSNSGTHPEWIRIKHWLKEPGYPFKDNVKQALKSFIHANSSQHFSMTDEEDAGDTDLTQNSFFIYNESTYSDGWNFQGYIKHMVKEQLDESLNKTGAGTQAEGGRRRMRRTVATAKPKVKPATKPATKPKPPKRLSKRTNSKQLKS